MTLHIKPSHPETNSPFWMVFDGDRFVCVVNMRYQDGGIQNTKFGFLTPKQSAEVEQIFKDTVTTHQYWCDLENDGLDTEGF